MKELAIALRVKGDVNLWSEKAGVISLFVLVLSLYSYVRIVSLP